MRLLDWYNERRIRELEGNHSEMNPSDIKDDYYVRLRGNYGITTAVLNSQREVNYAVDLIDAVDESIPCRIKRFLINALDSFLPVV